VAQQHAQSIREKSLRKLESRRVSITNIALSQVQEKIPKDR
jgi:hypothetical protein